jgi:hypothetical protein
MLPLLSRKGRISGLLTATVAGAAWLLPIGLASADSDGGLSKARANVEKYEERILLFAHPTCTLNRTEYRGQTRTTAGRDAVGYTFHFTGALGGKWETTLHFVYDGTGSLVDIIDGKSTTWNGPWTAANLAINTVKGWLEKDEDLKKNRFLMAAIDRADAKAILLIFLP